MKRPGTFDGALLALEDGVDRAYSVELKAELRAAIAVLRACEKADAFLLFNRHPITGRRECLTITDAMDIARAILKARKIAERNQKEKK